MRRRFSPRTYASIIERQDGVCACGCGEPLGTDPREIQFDHETPIWAGGVDMPENVRALKKRHHMDKTRKEAKARAKADRIRAREGLMRKRLSARDKALAGLLGRG